MPQNLDDYRRKRDPGSTPEPFGRDRPTLRLPLDAARRFVVQQHGARSMHWDLRLEIDGVLASWAVPKGPSLDPDARRLAVRTEDHPLDYANFEGVIPSGNYGAGAMIVWDAGSYRVVDGIDPAQGLADGKLDLWLQGHKLIGRFALVRTKEEGGRHWLLLHKRRGRSPSPPKDSADETEITQTLRRSVLSGLTIQERLEGVTHSQAIRHHARHTKAPQSRIDARKLRPMLAESTDEPFSRSGWLFELKYDGVRTLADKRGSAVTLYSRRGADVTAKYPEIARAVGHLPVEQCVLDGEIVVLDDRGASSFERIQKRFTQTEPQGIDRASIEHPAVYQAFDLLHAEGHDLRTRPLSLRKQLLALLTPAVGFVRFCDHVEGDGEALFEAAREHGLEGVVAKKADSRYEAGRRSSHWRKCKVPRTACFTIVGFSAGKGSRRGLGSLMLAWQRDGSLRYAGSAGSGLTEADIETLQASLGPLTIGSGEAPAAVGGLPDPLPARATLVKPELVCEVRFTEVTGAGLLRHPVFAGLRPDLGPDDCPADSTLTGSREDAAADREAASADRPVTSHQAPLQLTRLDKVFWPVEGFTKGDLLAYYEAAWPHLAPHLRDRPVVLTRYPDGIEGSSFYQKNAPEFTPAWVMREAIDGTDYFICNDLDTLLYVINSGAIPLHVWSARLHQLDRPDWCLLDLDPKEAPFAHVVELARHIHRLLDEHGTPNYVKSSGQDGLHVLVPLGGALDHEQCKALGEVLARVVCAERPEIATIARPLAARAERVYVDYLQNGRGKLVAAPFSVRPRPGAPVSMPLRWPQVTARLRPGNWTIRTALAEIGRRGDPLGPLHGDAADVPRLLDALGERLRASS